MTFNMEFGFDKALQYLNEGKCISRSGWNGKDLFVFKNYPTTVEKESILDLASMPTSAKLILYDRNIKITYRNQMLIVNKDGTIDSWVPSSSDVFAKDWTIYNG